MSGAQIGLLTTDSPFCETDLRIQQFVQETQLAANVMQADLHQRIMATLYPLVGLPMHTFGLAAVAIQDACVPAEPVADRAFALPLQRSPCEPLTCQTTVTFSFKEAQNGTQHRADVLFR